ncbi:DUF433 domain-containing protein [Natrialbaceae archaeon A-CW3]
MTIVSDEDILGGEPRIEGTRIGIRHIAGKVVSGGQTPAYVADQYDISLASVYEALSYYYANIEEMRAFEQENAEAFERVRDDSLQPKEPVS